MTARRPAKQVLLAAILALFIALQAPSALADDDWDSDSDSSSGSCCCEFIPAIIAIGAVLACLIRTKGRRRGTNDLLDD